MKKQLLTAFALTLGTLAIAQVGVHTTTPQASFDINAKPLPELPQKDYSSQG
ncbi:hypothetical protein ACFOEQ_24585 [Chryseobacterium arachidis]|uniref:hypothetical protein n=1 Tax=Chryseobacterium arachidis TaxID=1416778 RepID=UPI003608B2C9